MLNLQSRLGDVTCAYRAVVTLTDAEAIRLSGRSEAVVAASAAGVERDRPPGGRVPGARRLPRPKCRGRRAGSAASDTAA
jgi:hypothetical protein